MRKALNIFLVYMLVFSHATAFGAAITDDTLELGKPGSTANKTLRFGKGTGKPQIRYNATSTQLEFTNNGTDFLGIGSGSGGGSGINLLSEENKNPDFEVGGYTNWTASGFTPAVVTSGTNLLFGKASVTITASGSGQYLQSSLVTVTPGLENAACMAQIYYKGGDANWTAKVLDASGNLISSRVLAASTNRTAFQVPFNCATNASQYRVRIESTAAAALLALDRTHIGEQGLNNLAQAQLVASTKWPLAANCSWNAQAGVNSWSSFAADTDCTLPTASDISGTALIPATKQPSIRLASMKPGRYVFMARGSTMMETAGAYQKLRFSDGTSTTTEQLCGSSVNATLCGTVIGHLDVASIKGDSTFQIQQSGATAGVSIYNRTLSQLDMEFGIEVYYWPAGTELAVTPQTSNWRAAASIAGSDMNLGLVTVGTDAEMTNSSMTLTPETGSASIGIACANGNASTVGSTTCSAGNESNGITVSVPYAGEYEVCAQYSNYISGGTNSVIQNYFKIFETGSTSTTALQTVGGVYRSEMDTSTSADRSSYPINQCGVATFATAGQKTLRLMYTLAVTNVASANIVVGSGSGANIRWSIRAIGQNSPMPIMVGPYSEVTSQTTNYTLSTSDDYAEFNTTSGTLTATLFPATGNRGKRVTIKKTVTANLLIINPSGAETIEGLSSTRLHGAGESIKLISNGANWKLDGTDLYRQVSFQQNASGGIDQQDGNAITSPGRNSAGDYTVAFQTGIFSDTPMCIPGAIRTTGNWMANVLTVSSSGLRVIVTSSGAGAGADAPYQVICRGKR